MAAKPSDAGDAGESDGVPVLEGELGPFELASRTRLVFGAGSLLRLRGLVEELGGRRVLLVTDPGILAAGHVERVLDSLAHSSVRVGVFSGVRENPDTVCVEQCLAAARELGPDVIVGMGGGSSMDTAKGCNFLLTNGGRMHDYWGVGKATRPMLPLIAVPTTAGTGSECQSAALISDAETHVKMACLDPKAAARVAVLDPELTVSQPRRVTACTGIDAIAHAVESAVTRKRNVLSEMYSREAFRLLVPSLPRVLAAPGDLAARGRMLMGSALAGLAIENSMLGSAHAAANPLTARFGVVHGVAVGLVLPYMVELNAADALARARYEELARMVCPAPASGRDQTGTARLIEVLNRHLDRAGMPGSLRDAGVDPDAIGVMAEEASRQWTAGFNPVAMSASDFAGLYRRAMEPRRRTVSSTADDGA